MVFLSLILRFVSILAVCVPYIHHVYSFQSSCSLTRLSSVKVSLSTRLKESNSASVKPNESPKQSYHTIQWENKYDLLCQYKKREGHANPPQSHEENGVRLGLWVFTQRKAFKKGKLLQERQSRLEALGVTLVDVNRKKEEMKWDEMFDLLCIYKKREGRPDPLVLHQENGVQLGQWLATQRKSFRNGTLQADRQSKLEALGVVLVDVKRKKDEMKWDAMCDLLCMYSEREGDVMVPTTHQENGVKLGLWVMKQRKLYKAGELNVEREKRLVSLGMEWDGDHAHRMEMDMRWENWFKLLNRYREREGHTNISANHIEDGKSLGRWLTFQRSCYRDGTLKPERADKLDSLGVQWERKTKGNSYDLEWQNMYNLLCSYKKREGHTNVPCGHKENGTSLGKWLNRQRTLNRQWRLPEDRERKLDLLGVKLNGDSVIKERSDSTWEKWFGLLCAYKEREGDTNVPPKHKENGKTLGTWLKTQRRYGRNGELQEERHRKLKSLGVQFDQQRANKMRREAKWEEMFSLLSIYKERVGNINVRYKHQEDGKKLGIWLYFQLQYGRDGRLSSEKKKKLESLGIDWNPDNKAGK